MESKREQENKTILAATLLAMPSALILPFYVIDTKLAIEAAFVVTCVLAYACHERGKSRRIVKDTGNSIWDYASSFFASPLPSYNIANAKQNVIEGGSAYALELLVMVFSKK
jgi:hypothetical protein